MNQNRNGYVYGILIVNSNASMIEKNIPCLIITMIPIRIYSVYVN